MDRRREYLRLLAIFHFIYAGLMVAGSLVPIVWLAFASLWFPELAADIERDGGGMPVVASGALALGLAGIGVVLGWIWAGIVVFAGRNLLVARRHTFCMVVAGIACLSVPLGTVLGVASLVLLNRDDMIRLFAGGETD